LLIQKVRSEMQAGSALVTIMQRISTFLCDAVADWRYQPLYGRRCVFCIERHVVFTRHTCTRIHTRVRNSTMCIAVAASLWLLSQSRPLIRDVSAYRYEHSTRWHMSHITHYMSHITSFTSQTCTAVEHGDSSACFRVSDVMTFTLRS
jgi:hypothetical protein